MLIHLSHWAFHALMSQYVYKDLMLKKKSRDASGGRGEERRGEGRRGRERRGAGRGDEERRCRASGCSVSRQYSWSICLPPLRRQPAATTRWQTPLKQKYFLCPSPFPLLTLFLSVHVHISVPSAILPLLTPFFLLLFHSFIPFWAVSSFLFPSSPPIALFLPHSLCVSQASAQKNYNHCTAFPWRPPTPDTYINIRSRRLNILSATIGTPSTGNECPPKSPNGTPPSKKVVPVPCRVEKGRQKKETRGICLRLEGRSQF